MSQPAFFNAPATHKDRKGLLLETGLFHLERTLVKKIATTVIAIFVYASAGTAFADTSAPAGLTRMQVREQIVQAEREGTIPTTDTSYPPSADDIARNKATYEAQFGKSDAPERWVREGH
jgi:hypothetical protein